MSKLRKREQFPQSKIYSAKDVAPFQGSTGTNLVCERTF